MKKHLKQVLCLLLALTMTFALAACGGGGEASDSGDSGESGSSGSTSSGEQTSDGEYPVVRWAYTHMFGTESEPKIEAAMNEILRESAGAEIDLVPVSFGDLETQFNLMLAGGSDSIDIFSSFWYLPLANLVSNGQLAELDDLLASDGEGILDLFADYPEVLECCKINGKMYALPTVGPYSSPMLYLVKETDSKSANIDWSQVHTLDDATQAMLAMKAVNPDHYYVPAATETYWVPKDIDYFGDTNFLGVLTDPLNSTKVENYYESDYFMNFLDNVKIWQENDIFSPDAMSNNNPNLLSIQLGLAQGTPGYGFEINEWCYEANAQGQYGDNMVGAQLGDRIITTGNITTYLWHITSFSKQKDVAMRVLREFYLDARLANLLGNGIEGENYVVNDDGTLAFPEGKDMTNCGWIGLGATYSLPNSSEVPVWYFQPKDFWEIAEQSNKEAKPSLALGFTFDSSNVADQVTACTNVIAQYYLPLINGEVDIDETLPVFQQALHDAGVDDIIAEKQAQLDEWLANK